ncbi:MAG: hypothetical protein AUK36_04045 [Zetaproteobacteria bacterium CG2_30_59_37]|nr:MAG: hypothetical protein AUK36_04045 [Zetaproteobacteria bacterium CG2_30_59_37]
MKRFIEGQRRTRGTLLPDMIDDYVEESNPVRIVDVFVDELDLELLGFTGVNPADTGRPSYHTDTSTASNQAVAWSGKLSATLN